jgi:uncharacterized protein
MPKNKNQSRVVDRSSTKSSAHSKQPSTVSGRWLLIALGITLVAAIFCAWASLALLFWQGSWQLLYHPTATVARTPASVGVPFEPVGFAATETGLLRLQGWWIPAAPNARFSRYTVLFLHGQNGNLGDQVDALARLHSVGMNILAFDYRGYGQSLFERPSKPHWRQDVEWALGYLTQTRHIDPRTIVLYGNQLGANLALEVAAAHPELGGVVLESPLEDPMSAIFNDPRSRLLPAHVLVRDHFDLDAAAAALRIPSLWLSQAKANDGADTADTLPAFGKVSAPKQAAKSNSSMDFDDALMRWLDGLAAQ